MNAVSDHKKFKYNFFLFKLKVKKKITQVIIPSEQNLCFYLSKKGTRHVPCEPPSGARMRRGGRGARMKPMKLENPKLKWQQNGIHFSHGIFMRTPWGARTVRTP